MLQAVGFDCSIAFGYLWNLKLSLDLGSLTWMVPGNPVVFMSARAHFRSPKHSKHNYIWTTKLLSANAETAGMSGIWNDQAS